MSTKDVGLFSKELDAVERILETWSDGQPKLHYNQTQFTQLHCNNCLSRAFTVLAVPEGYETVAQCINCNKYFSVHTG